LQFYGSENKGVEGSLKQLIEASGPFRSLYDIITTDQGIERVLKAALCGNDTDAFYTAGEHFTASLVSRVIFKN